MDFRKICVGRGVGEVFAQNIEPQVTFQNQENVIGSY